MRGAVGRRDGLTQRHEIGVVLRLQRGCSQRRLRRQLLGQLARQTQVHAGVGQRLGKQMVVGRATAADGRDGMQLGLVIDPERTTHGIEEPRDRLTQRRRHVLVGIQPHAALAHHHGRVGHAAHHGAFQRQRSAQRLKRHTGHHRDDRGVLQLTGRQRTQRLARHHRLHGHHHQVIGGVRQVGGLTVQAGLHILGTDRIHGIDAIHQPGTQPGLAQGCAHATISQKESVQTHALLLVVVRSRGRPSRATDLAPVAEATC